MNLIDCLKMTKKALQNEQAELHRCNRRYHDIQREIMEIDLLILKMERSEARRRSIYEKRIRDINRDRNRKIRRRIYMGLRMDSIGTNHNSDMVNFRNHFIGGGYENKNDIRSYRFQCPKI